MHKEKVNSTGVKFKIIPMKSTHPMDERGEYWVQIIWPNGSKQDFGRFENSFIGENVATKWIDDNLENFL